MIFHFLLLLVNDVNPSRIFEFERDPVMDGVDCGRLVDGDCEYIRRMSSKRIKMPNNKLEMSCDAIRRRVIRYSEYPIVANPIAFVKVVDENYEFLEEQLSFTFHPHSRYCFAPDRKTNGTEFHANLLKLAECIPNVDVTDKLFDVTAGGAYMSHSFYECWKLVQKESKWTYLLDMQNHDIVTKTAVELSEIVGALNGSNAIQLSKCVRCGNKTEGELLNELHFHGEKEYFPSTSRLKYAVGLVQSLISRKAIEFLTNSLNLTDYLRLFTTEEYAIDEMFLGTLQQTEELRIPGGMTSRCLREGHETEKIVRNSNWDCSGKKCSTGLARHCICVQGIEDLPVIATYPHVIANKLLPQFDYAAIVCVGEMIYNRTYGFRRSFVDESVYRNLSHTRYQTFDEEDSDETPFSCESQLSQKLYGKWENNWFESIADRSNSSEVCFRSECCSSVSSEFYPSTFPDIRYLSVDDFTSQHTSAEINISGFTSYEFLMSASFLLSTTFFCWRRRLLSLRYLGETLAKLRKPKEVEIQRSYHSLRLLLEESEEEFNIMEDET